jgi:hypothetical protein
METLEAVQNVTDVFDGFVCPLRSVSNLDVRANVVRITMAKKKVCTYVMFRRSCCYAARKKTDG